MSPKIRKNDSKDYGIDTGCGKMSVIFRLDAKKQPINCKVLFGKSGVCGASQTEAISRLIKILLKNNIALPEIVKQLKGIQCSSQTENVKSCADAIGIAMEEFMKDMELYESLLQVLDGVDGETNNASHQKQT